MICEKDIKFGEPEIEYYGLNVCVTQNSHVEILIPKIMVLGDGAFGR